MNSAISDMARTRAPVAPGPVYEVTVGAIFVQHFDADLAGGDLAQRDDRRLVAVGLDAAARRRR